MHRWHLRKLVVLAIWLAVGCVGRATTPIATPTTASTPNTVPAVPDAARFIRQIPWAGKGTWVKADTHTHTRFSDGSHTPDEVAAKAAEHGCQVIAITDHADNNLRAATPEYADAIRAI